MSRIWFAWADRHEVRSLLRSTDSKYSIELVAGCCQTRLPWWDARQKRNIVVIDKQPGSEMLITLTADIVAAHVSNNSVTVGDVATLIANVHLALSELNKPAESIEEKPKGAVSIRSSVKTDHIVSMIDGRPYKMLRRHLSQHGYTPESYREAFGLPRDYPMVAPAYAAQRRELAMQIGLGRKPGQKDKSEPARPKPAGRPRKSVEPKPGS